MNADRPNALDFADVAERRRLDGDALAAVQIAEAGLAQAPDDLRGRIALALARIDMGDVLEARDELAAALHLTEDAAPFLTAPLVSVSEGELSCELDDDELETAFAQAESDPEQMMSANRVVEQTLRAAELDAPEIDSDDTDASDGDFDISNRPTYATESMAALLDRQGRRAEAEALRHSLSRASTQSRGPAFPGASNESDWSAAALGPEHARRLRVVATLEGWLHNLRRAADNDARSRERSGARGTV